MKWTLGKKLISGMVGVSLLIGVAGFLGLWNIGKISKATHQISDVGAPLVGAALNMEFSLSKSQDVMGQYVSATATVATFDESRLKGLNEDYQETLEGFDGFVDVILQNEGASKELKDLAEKSDVVHNEKFQKAATDVMEFGKKMISEQKRSHSAMLEMEGAYDKIIDFAEKAEERQWETINERASKNSNLSINDFKKDLKVIDMIMEVKFYMAASRIKSEELAQMSELDGMDGLRREYDDLIEQTDVWIATMISGGETDVGYIEALKDQKVRNFIKTLDEYHDEFQDAVKIMFSTQKGMIEAKDNAHESVEAMNSYSKEAAVLLGNVAKLAHETMSMATENAARVDSSATTTITLTSILGLAFGIIFGVLFSNRLTKLLSEIIANISSSSSQMTSASEEISSSSQQLAQGASEQASSLEETSSSLEEMAAMIKQNADNAVEANQLSSRAKETAEDGAKAVSEMIGAMGEINESSGKISNIIKVIDEIAFQTNLLALNAAVEAARAGEHGKGFAVVAEEVRNLAQRSATAAKDTAELIEESVKKSSEGSDLADKSGKVLDEIVTGVNKVTNLISEIAAASREQADGIDQLTTAVSQMDKVTQQTASNSEELAAGSEELLSQSSSLKDMVSLLESEVTGGNGHMGGYNNVKISKLRSGIKKRVTQRPVASKSFDTTKSDNKKHIKLVNSEDVIPMGDDDLSDF